MELDTMFLKKTPPHSQEAERTVLGGILVRIENLNVVLSTISPEDFYRDAHRKILERIISLVDRGLPVDLLSLTEDAQRAGILEEVGGSSGTRDACSSSAARARSPRLTVPSACGTAA